MDFHLALTTVCHRNRHRKPEIEVAQETGIRLYQLRKFRTGVHEPKVSQVKALVRCYHEIDPVGALTLANAALPTELMTASSVGCEGDDLSKEVLQVSSVAGQISAAYLRAMEDGRWSLQELDEMEEQYGASLDEAQQGLAAVQKERTELKRRLNID